jgi:hypothetical protein
VSNSGLKAASNPPETLFQRLARDEDHECDDDHYAEGQTVGAFWDQA